MLNVYLLVIPGTRVDFSNVNFRSEGIKCSLRNTLVSECVRRGTYLSRINIGNSEVWSPVSPSSKPTTTTHQPNPVHSWWLSSSYLVDGDFGGEWQDPQGETHWKHKMVKGIQDFLHPKRSVVGPPPLFGRFCHFLLFNSGPVDKLSGPKHLFFSVPLLERLRTCSYWFWDY